MSGRLERVELKAASRLAESSPLFRLAFSEDRQHKKLTWRMFRQFHAPEQIADEFGFTPAPAWSIAEQTTDESASKLLLRAAGGTACEAVALFPPGNQSRVGPDSHNKLDSNKPPRKKIPRATACISSQPGCGVGCPFCATGELGFQGNLTAAEIAEQVYWAGVVANRAGRRLRNVVYMGMGEPMHNLESVLGSLQLLTSEQVFGIPPRRITVSTAGVPEAMRCLAREFPEIRIALSLHAAEAELRRRLVPRAVGDLQLLRETVRSVNALQANHPVWLEVVLFDKLNDSLEHARLLVDFCQSLRVEVNLIPYNSAAGDGEFAPTSKPQREAFASVLRAAGIRTTMRTSFGQDHNAACGQLRGRTT